jgi:putative flippase GtrA
MKSFMSRQFLVFLLTGGTAALVNFGSRIFYNQWLSFSNSIVIAYVTGMITAFILARLFVFKQSQQSLQKSILFFTLVNVAAVIQTWSISLGLAYYLLPRLHVVMYAKEIAHAFGVIVPVFTSYIGHRRWSFK